MANIDLTQYGINGVKSIKYNPSYEELFNDEMAAPEGYEKGQTLNLIPLT